MQGKVARAAAALCAGTMLLTGCGGTENAQQTAGKAGDANGSSASVHAGGATHPFAGGCGIPSHLRRAAAAGSGLPSGNGVALPTGSLVSGLFKSKRIFSTCKTAGKAAAGCAGTGAQRGMRRSAAGNLRRGNPHRLPGLFAQAWSVGELLRVYEALERPRMEH